MKKNIPIILFVLMLMVGFVFTASAGVKPGTKTFDTILASTLLPKAYFPVVYRPQQTSTNTPSPTPLSVPTTTPIPPAFFSVGYGFSDVIPHQVVRTAADRLYIFAPRPYSTAINVYAAAGIPSRSSDFSQAAQVAASSEPLSLDAIYDGGNIVHVLIITRGGEIKDYPFFTNTNQFKSPITLATDSGTLNGDYIGTSGISGMFDLSGSLHIAYWTKMNHIAHRLYTYNSTTNSLTPSGGITQVDSAGNANHPAVAVSPLDNSLTVAWISQSTNPARILVRTRSSEGVWGNIQTVSTSPVWTSTSAGINIDQGPSLIISQDGKKHLLYIQNYDGAIDYGRIHYVTSSSSSWVDQALSAYSHDPALAINRLGEIYIIGHGHPLNAACKSMSDMCTIKKNPNGTWGNPQLFAPHPPSTTFDASPSVKWSVVGFNRPELVEFVFFVTPYSNPVMYYGRFGTH